MCFFRPPWPDPISTRAEMTFPRADRDILICVASFNRVPVAPVLDCLSLPAKSTRFNFPTQMCSSPSMSFMLLVKLGCFVIFTRYIERFIILMYSYISIFSFRYLCIHIYLSSIQVFIIFRYSFIQIFIHSDIHKYLFIYIYSGSIQVFNPLDPDIQMIQHNHSYLTDDSSRDTRRQYKRSNGILNSFDSLT